MIPLQYEMDEREEEIKQIIGKHLTVFKVMITPRGSYVAELHGSEVQDYQYKNLQAHLAEHNSRVFLIKACHNSMCLYIESLRK